LVYRLGIDLLDSVVGGSAGRASSEFLSAFLRFPKLGAVVTLLLISLSWRSYRGVATRDSSPAWESVFHPIPVFRAFIRRGKNWVQTF